MTPVQRYAFKAIAVMRAGLFAGAVVTGIPYLLQKLLFNGQSLFVAALPVQVVLQDGQFISVNFHKCFLRIKFQKPARIGSQALFVPRTGGNGTKTRR